MTLTVTDDDGGTDTDSVTITVNPNQAPTAAISANPQTGAYPLEVTFDSSASADPDGSIASVLWNFGDGDTSSDAGPIHTYTGAGNYTATLTVTDDNGASDTTTVTINVVQDNDGDGFSPPTDCDDSAAAIYPGAADPLDASGVDSNCDGVDGVLADTVFVDSTGGADNGSCGPLGSPCATIDQGVTNANATNKGVVQVSSGSYSGFTLTGDLTVRGGYESDFSGRLGTTAVTGNGTGVLANGTIGAATLADLNINSGSPSGAGASAYGVRAVSGSTLEITDSVVTAQDGNAGTNGCGRRHRCERLQRAAPASAPRTGIHPKMTARRAAVAVGWQPRVTAAKAAKAVCSRCSGGRHGESRRCRRRWRRRRRLQRMRRYRIPRWERWLGLVPQVRLRSGGAAGTGHELLGGVTPVPPVDPVAPVSVVAVVVAVPVAAPRPLTPGVAPVAPVAPVVAGGNGGAGGTAGGGSFAVYSHNSNVTVIDTTLTAG